MMKINPRDFLILGMLSMCIMSQIISTSTTTTTSGSVSAGTGSGLLGNLGGNLGLNTLISTPLSLTNNLLSLGSTSNTIGSDGSGLLNLDASVNTNGLLNTVGNTVGSVVNTVGQVVDTVGDTVSVVGNTVSNVGDNLGSVTGGISLPTVNIDGNVLTDINVNTGTQVPLLDASGLLQPVLNTVGNVLDPVLNTANVITTTNVNTAPVDISNTQNVLLNTNGLLDPVLNTVGNVLDPVLNTVDNVLSNTGLSTAGGSYNYETLPVGQVLNTVVNLGTSIPIIGAPTQTMTQAQVGVPVVTQPLLSTLTSTVDNLLSGLLGVTLFGTPSFYVDSTLTQPVNKIYTLQGGYIEIEFDFRVISKIVPTGASMIVFIDNYPVYRVLASQSGKRIKISIPTKILKGQHSVRFLPIKGSTTLSFSFYISNLIVYEKQIFPQLIGNILANGGFEINGCTNTNRKCLWNSQNFLANFVPGWTPIPEIKIVKSTLLNPAIGNSWVAELDASANTCIVQNINLRQGRHFLKFNRAARVNTPLPSNGILVILNRQLLKSIASADYGLHTENLEFYVNSNVATVELAICGAGRSDGVGALIDSIDLKFEDESLFRINKY